MNKRNINKFFVALCFLITSMICICHNLILDDYVWHVKIGEWIIQNKEIPTTCIYSWSNGANHWYCHEWLSEIIFYFIYTLFPIMAPYVYSGLTIGLVGILIMYINRDYLLKNPIFFLVWTLSYTIIMISFSNPRPHLLTLSFLILFIKILDEIKKEKYNNFWMIPIIAILWTNVHGGSTPLLYLFPIVYIVIGLFNWEMGKIKFQRLNRKQFFTYAIVEVLSIFSIIINPIGLELLKYPYHVSSANNFYIKEWTPLNINILPEGFIIIIATCIILFMTKEIIEAQDLANIGIFIIMSLLHLRFALWLTVIASLYVFKYIPTLKIKNEVLKSNMKDAIKVYPIIGLIALILLHICFDIKPQTTIPEEIIMHIKNESPERLYNDYNYGGVLINNDIESFIDPRADSYQENEIFDETMSLLDFNIEKEKQIKDFIEKWNFDAFLCNKNSYLFLYLNERPEEYELMIDYEDYEITYFKKIV